MANYSKVNEIATEDAIEVIHELSDADFMATLALLVSRRTKNRSFAEKSEFRSWFIKTAKVI